MQAHTLGWFDFWEDSSRGWSSSDGQSCWEELLGRAADSAAAEAESGTCSPCARALESSFLAGLGA